MRWLSDLLFDVRVSIRGFLRSPGFCTVAVITIALGTGANTAVFSLTQKLLLDRFPVYRPDQLVELDCIDRTDPQEGQCDASWPGYQMYRENTQLFSGLFAYSAIADLNVAYGGNAHLASALLASAEMHEVLGVAPFQGRLLRPTDDERAAPLVAVVSYSYWRERFGADPAIIGQTVRLNAHPVTIVGVTPEGFRGVTLGEPSDITLPMGSATDTFLRPGSLQSGTNWWLKIMGRRKDGVSLEGLEASLAPVFQRTVEHMISSAGPEDRQEYRDVLKTFEFRVRSARGGGFSELRSNLDHPLRILMGFVGLVLLVACANLAGLFLTRISARRHELAVRFSLGASRLRLARQFWTESLLLSLTGGVTGLFLARWSAPLLLRMASGERAASTIDLSPNLDIFLFAGIAVAFTAFLMGAGPALGLSVAPEEALRAARSSRPTSRLAWILVPAQVMLATLLLVGAGLLVRTLANIRSVELGYQSDQLITLTTSPDLARYDEARRTAYWNEITAKIAALPGVASVTLSGDPIGRLNTTTYVDIPGFQAVSLPERSTARKRVGARFASTAGMTLLRGKDLEISDADSSVGATLVNASFAQHFFRTIDVIDRQIAFNIGPAQAPLRIVGVVADAHDRSPRIAPERVMYTLTPSRLFGTASIGIRVEPNRGSPTALISLVRTAVAEADPGVPIREIRTVDEQIDETLGRDRLLVSLGTFFGVLALLMVAIGLYGVLAANVTRRTREIGIRLALGAPHTSIVWLVAAEGLGAAAIGVVGGLGIGLILTRFIQNQLFGIEPNDPLTLAMVTSLLVSVAFFAALLPARRAMRIAPRIALSQE